MELTCKECRNLEICRYASIMKDATKKVEDLVGDFPFIKVNINCIHFIPKNASFSTLTYRGMDLNC